MLINSGKNLLFPINTVSKVTLSINQFFKFLIKLLGVRSNVLNASSLHMLLDFVPILSIQSQSFQK